MKREPGLHNSDLVKQMEWGIKKDSYVPLYHQVKEALYSKIIDGYWPRGEPIPSERNLSEMMGVSRITVIRALKELTDDGTLRRERGRGTFVAEQNMQQHDRRRVGVVIHQAELFIDSFFSDIFLGIQKAAEQLGFELILLPYHDNAEGVRESFFCINNAWQKKLGSMIVAVEEIDETELEHLREQKIPFVMINKQLTKVEGDWLAVDWELGMYKLTKKLLKVGYRNFGVLGGLLNKLPSDREKYVGVQRALTEANLPMPFAHFREWPYEKRNEAAEAAGKLVRDMKKPGAILCADDHFGVQVIKSCYQLNLRIPQDVAVTGTGDFNIANNIHPGLTTVHVNRYRLGRQAMLIIGDRLTAPDKEGYVQLKLEPQIVVRGSTASLDASKESLHMREQANG